MAWRAAARHAQPQADRVCLLGCRVQPTATAAARLLLRAHGGMMLTRHVSMATNVGGAARRLLCKHAFVRTHLNQTDASVRWSANVGGARRGAPGGLLSNDRVRWNLSERGRPVLSAAGAGRVLARAQGPQTTWRSLFVCSRPVLEGAAGPSAMQAGARRPFSSAQGGSEAADGLSLKKRFQQMAKDYGKVILLSHSTIWAASLAGTWMALKSMDMTHFMALLPTAISSHVDPSAGAFAIAFVVVKLTGPGRLMIDLAITPVLARYLRCVLAWVCARA